MKKILSIIFAAVLVISLSSCGNAYRKVIPESQTTPPAEQQDAVDEIPVQDTEETDSHDTDDTGNEDEQSSKPEDVKINTSGLNNEKISQWMPGRNKVHNVPQLNAKHKALLDKYGGYFTGDASSKVIYLTFDEGYENGYTSQILDILKANDVRAAFFVTKPYIKSSPDLVRRMVEEGHIVGNHSNSHPSMPDVSDEQVKKEITDTADYFKEITGVEMPGFFRPPMGEFSERTLYITQSLGYKTILWSMAHRDWIVDDQPGREAAIQFVDTYYHNGAILLLHAVSKSNTDALEDIIKNMKANGYRFAPLSELK